MDFRRKEWNFSWCFSRWLFSVEWFHLESWYQRRVWWSLCQFVWNPVNWLFFYRCWPFQSFPWLHLWYKVLWCTLERRQCHLKWWIGLCWYQWPWRPRWFLLRWMRFCKFHSQWLLRSKGFVMLQFLVRIHRFSSDQTRGYFCRLVFCWDCFGGWSFCW